LAARHSLFARRRRAMTSAVFAIPGDLDLPTGGYAYDRSVLALLPQFGVNVRHLPLPASFPFPTEADLAETAQALRAVDRGFVLMIDGLAYGAMPAALIDALPSPILALVHHPLCLEAGLDDAARCALLASELTALARAAGVLVTSPTTASTLAADFRVPQHKITVAVPGTDPAPRAQGTAGRNVPLQLLSVGSVVPRKAYDTLVRALARLRDRDWRLTIAGPADRHAGARAALEAALRDTGLGPRVALHGPATAKELANLYAAADLFVMASLYEGYGMVLAEALARGLPIVCTTGGAASETVPDAAALKVAPGDERALGEAIGRALDDANLRRRLADAGWAAGQMLPRWEDTARTVAAAIHGIAPGGMASRDAAP
jgi:glycosyltransferase involved in cell wall biosynthesis